MPRMGESVFSREEHPTVYPRPNASPENTRVSNIIQTECGLYEVCADASTYIHITTINENQSHELEKEQSVVYKKGLGGRKDREDDVIIL